MHSVMRFSLAGVVSIMATGLTFLMMMALLRAPSEPQISPPADINFSFQRVEQPLKTETPPQPKPPEMITKEPPPQAPPMDFNTDTPSPDISLPESLTQVFGGSRGIGASDLGGLGPGIGLIPDQGGTVQAAIAPVYPREKLLKGIEGWVEVLITVNAAGRVESVQVLSSGSQQGPQKQFERAAVTGVKKWSFHPRIVDGKAVPFSVKQKIEFSLNQE